MSRGWGDSLYKRERAKNGVPSRASRRNASWADTPFQTSELQASKIINVYVVLGHQIVGICYSSNGKQIHNIWYFLFLKKPT